jgi:transposase
MNPTKPLKVTPSELRDLEELVRKRTARAGHVRRARVVLLAALGVSGREIARRLALTPPRVSEIRRRFELGRVAGLADRPRAGRKDHAVTPAQVERIVSLAVSPPPAGHARWSTRMLGARVGLTSATVAKVLRANDLKPHRARTFKVSRGPDFASKVRDVVGLYLNPPHNAVVVSVDEKTQIQALERTQLMLPLRPGKVARHTHDYERHGVLDLYAALNVATGEVTHQCTERHTAKEFLGFLSLLARQYRGRELHVILDNSSAHGTPAVQRWLERHPLVKFHYTPTSASWLNQVEALFSILTRKSLRHSDFPSKTALRKHIQAFLERWNQKPTPFIWTKKPHRLIRDHRRMLARISHAVH